MNTEAETVVFRLWDQVYDALLTREQRRAFAKRLPQRDRAIIGQLMLTALILALEGRSLAEIVQVLRERHMPKRWQ